MNRKIAIPAVVLGLGLGVAALTPNIASAESYVIERPNPVTVVPTNPAGSLTVKVDSVDVASGTARISGTVAETTFGFINANGTVAASWGAGYGLTDHKWSGTVRGLVAGDNTISIEQYSKASENTPRQLWKQIADTTTLHIQVGEGTGFTAGGVRHEDGSITVSGTATPDKRLTIADTKYNTEYAFAQSDAEGNYTATIPAGYFTGATIVVKSTDGQRAVPASQLTR
jgi:hypothetical protein